MSTIPIGTTQAQLPYTFDHAYPRGHLLREFVEYVAARNDAAYELAEAVAHVVVAVTAPPQCFINIARFGSKGLGLNVYVTLIGPAGRTRKTRVAALGKEIIEQHHAAKLLSLPRTAIPPYGPLLQDAGSPEGLIDALALRPQQACLWMPDEMGPMIEEFKKPYMKRWVTLLLQAYNPGFKYEDSTRKNQSVKVDDPRLSICGNLTDEVFQRSLTSADTITGGFSHRFAHVMPDGNRPPPVGICDPIVTAGGVWSTADFVTALLQLPEGPITVDPSAANTINTLQHEFEFSDDTILTRHGEMLIKYAGHSALCRGSLVITKADTDGAEKTVRRHATMAQQFAKRLGEGWINRFVERAKRFIDNHGVNGVVERSDLMAHLSPIQAWQLREVGATMQMLGLIDEVQGPAKPGAVKGPMLWVKLKQW